MGKIKIVTNADALPITPTRLIGKMQKIYTMHNLGYIPFIEIYCKKITKAKVRFPYFEFHPSFISHMDFYFLHEPYSKKNFQFVVRIFKNQEPVLVSKLII